MNPPFEALMDYLRQSHSFDFTGYKRSSLVRRVQYRMQMIKIESYGDYGDYLKEHPEEFTPLFNTIEINFTSFFRNPSVWEYITESIIPQIIAGKSSAEPIRVWSAGCASGEETYTLASVLAEALGAEQFCSRVKIYGTDIDDEEALNQARQGSYSSNQVVDIPPTLLERYFDQNDGRYVFSKDLRRSITFCRHDLIQDAPMSKIDLLLCRNVMIYLNIDAQTRALARFHFGLKDSGFLFLGMAEMLPMHTSLFTPLNPQQRIFTKVPKGDLNQRQLHRALDRRWL